MRESDRNKRSLIIVGLCSIVLIMAVGFAAFSQQLQINSTSEVTSSWDIEITDIQGANPYGGDAYDVNPPTYTPTTASFSTGLISPGDERIYQVEVSNLGTLTGQVSVASLSCGNNPAIECGAMEADSMLINSNGEWAFDPSQINIFNFNNGTYDYSNLGFTLAPTEKHYIMIRVGYSYDVETQPANLSANITLTLNYVQAETHVPTIETVYAINTNTVYKGESTLQDLGTTSSSCAETGNNVCIKYTLEDGIVAGADVCFIKGGTEYCLQGWIDECEWDGSSCTFTGTPTVYNANKQIVQDYQTYYNVDSSKCSYTDEGSNCEKDVDNLIVASSSGDVLFEGDFGSNSVYSCFVYNDGSSVCSSSPKPI